MPAECQLSDIHLHRQAAILATVPETLDGLLIEVGTFQTFARSAGDPVTQRCFLMWIESRRDASFAGVKVMKLPKRQTAAVACLLALGGLSSSVSAQSVDELFDGAWRYLASCAGCHANDGSGIYPFGTPLKGNAFVQSAPVPVLIQVIQQGRNYGERNHLAYVGMPAFHYIRGGEAIALVNYMKNDLQN